MVVGETAERDPSAAIGGSLAAQDYNLDVYMPLSTLRARIGDMVMTSRSGSQEGEVVELSQITVSLPNVDQVEKPPRSSARCWRSTTRNRISVSWCRKNCCGRRNCCG